MSFFPKRVKPNAKEALDKIAKEYQSGNDPDQMEICLNEYAMNWLRYYQPKPILLVRGRLDANQSEDIVKSLAKAIPDWHVIVAYSDQRDLTHEHVSEKDLNKGQLECLKELIKQEQIKL